MVTVARIVTGLGPSQVAQRHIRRYVRSWVYGGGRIGRDSLRGVTLASRANMAFFFPEIKPPTPFWHSEHRLPVRASRQVPSIDQRGRILCKMNLYIRIDMAAVHEPSSQRVRFMYVPRLARATSYRPKQLPTERAMKPSLPWQDMHIGQSVLA